MARINQAQIDLNKKLRIERVLYVNIRNIFESIIQISTQPFVSLTSYELDIEDVLFKHYLQVFNIFGDDYRDAHNIKVTKQFNDAMEFDIRDQFMVRASRQSGIISATNKRQLSESKQIAREKIANLALINPNLTYNGVLKQIYTNALFGRVDAIACYETQWCAEFSKAFEVNYLLFNNGIEAKAPKLGNKRWDAVGDDKMRAWHAHADSQIKPVDEPFVVNGELLMYPGDTSLGATASNIINCRCSTSYALSAAALSAATRGREAVGAFKEGALVDEKLINTIDKRLAKVLQEAEATGDLELISEANKLVAEFDRLKIGFEGGSITARAPFSNLAGRADKLRKRIKDGGIIPPKPKPVVKPKPTPVPTAVKPAIVPLRDRPEYQLLKGNVKLYRTGEIVPDRFVPDFKDAVSKAKAEFENVFGAPSFKYLQAKDVRGAIANLNEKDGNGNDYNIAEKITNRVKTTVAYMRTVFRDVATNIFDMGLVSRELLDSSQLDTISSQIINGNFRAWANQYSNQMKFGTNSGKDVIAHEIGHHIEFRNRKVRERIVKWRDQRIDHAKNQGEKVVKFGQGETAWKDGFSDKYIGKIYEDGSTEVLSMGMQALFDDMMLRRIMQNDPDHMYLIWATLRGY